MYRSRNDKKPTITIEQAVRNVLRRYPHGRIVVAYEIYNDVMAELKCHEYPGYPLQETVARRYREVAESCCMVTLPSKGQYQKQLVALSKEELKLGQKALF